ncbi:hypothetical protein LWI29_035068 [Acer saccharum]|uniref:Uncharacterized protein n=1 Tax=Acer saccharum TaxID=4024 RepID=A0AA39SI74_ACESA|nr:hypothetical protein LWI29_035068 [Acer saccharum]
MDVGSLSHFYESLQNLPDSYLKPNQNKNSLLNPRVPILSAAAAATGIPLTLTSDDHDFNTQKAYTCASCISHMAVVPNLICPECERRSMKRELSYVNPPWKGGGFLKGFVSYIVMDNLEFMPMSTKMFVSLLNKFDVKDVSALEETEVELGVEENLLSRRGLFKKPQVSGASVFAEVAAPADKYSLLNPRVPIVSAAAAATEISLTLTSDGREFEFDTLKAYTCASCISHMAVVPNLICPRCERRSMNRELSYVNPPQKGGGFLKGLVSYIVMDNLEFMPMSTKMFVSLLNKFDVEDVSSLEETEVEVGVEEVCLS